MWIGKKGTLEPRLLSDGEELNNRRGQEEAGRVFRAEGTASGGRWPGNTQGV